MLLIKNGNVWLGKGDCRPGWDVLCDGKTIKAVGPDLAVEGAEVIDASGKTVYPGFVLAQCAIGATSLLELDGFGTGDFNDTTSPIQPQLDIRYGLDLREIKQQRFAQCGVTSYGLAPGTGALMAGQMAFVHVDGKNTKDVVLADRIALKGNYTGFVKTAFGGKQKAPMTRMGIYAMLDEAFRAAKEYLEKAEKDYDEGKEVICRVLRREIPFVVNAVTQSEVEGVCELGEKYGLDLVICGAYELGSRAETIIEHGWHVVLGADYGVMDGKLRHIDYAAMTELARRGLKLSLFSAGDQAYPLAYEQLLWTAALMHRGGASGEEILEMMTINPAKALRVDGLVGSIEPGKQADLIVCSGNPAERFDNFIERTVVAGREIFRREA